MKRLCLLAVCVIALWLACGAPRQEPQRVTAFGDLRVAARFPLAGQAVALAATDVDGDGRADLVAGSGLVDVLLGDGRGALAPAAGSPYPGAADAHDFAIGDVDRDGRADIVVADHGHPRFLVLRGVAGGFEPLPPFEVDATPHVHTIALCDYDRDGDLDVVTDSWPESALVLVDGAGDATFATPGRQLKIPPVPIMNLRMADMNGDGTRDIVVPAHDREAVSVLLCDGAGSFAPASGSPFPSFGGFSSVALADLDGDGDVDVAEIHRSDQSTQYVQDALSILLNDGAGGLAHAAGSPLPIGARRMRSLAIGDTDGDGRRDIAAFSERARAVLLFRGGAGGFEHVATHVLEARIDAIAAGDLDGDGRAELLVSAGSELVVLHDVSGVR